MIAARPSDVRIAAGHAGLSPAPVRRRRADSLVESRPRPADDLGQVRPRFQTLLRSIVVVARRNPKWRSGRHYRAVSTRSCDECMAGADNY
jgi:hypothetical protein